MQNLERLSCDKPALVHAQERVSIPARKLQIVNDDPLDRQAAGAPSAEDASAATCLAISETLTRVLGPRGVAALWRRSFELTSEAHPWLASLIDGDEDRVESDVLHGVFGRQGNPVDALASQAAIQTFRHLLGDLIGSSLADRLLRPVSGASPQRSRR